MKNRSSLLFASLLIGALFSSARAEAGEKRDVDQRSLELFRRECLTDNSRQDLTLFGNGTVRLKEGARDNQRMILAELNRDELAGFARRLDEEDLSGSWRRDLGLQGISIESCRIAVHREGGDPIVFYYGRFQSRTLALSRLVTLADELVSLAIERTPGERLPVDYVAEPGDVLRRGDGVLFQVVGFTSDGKGVELIGVDQPLLIYIEKDALSGEFIDVIRKRGDW